MDFFKFNYWCSTPSDITFTSEDAPDDITTMSPSAQIYYNQLNQQVQLFNAPNEHGWLSSDIDVANKCKDPEIMAAIGNRLREIGKDINHANMTDAQLISLCLDRGIDSSTFGTLQNDIDSLLSAARSVVLSEPAPISSHSVDSVNKIDTNES